MGENRCYTYRTDKADDEQPRGVYLAGYRSPVGELVLYDFLRYEPADENAGEERTKRQKNLCREIVAESQEIQSE